MGEHRGKIRAAQRSPRDYLVCARFLIGWRINSRAFSRFFWLGSFFL
jgi:hypothetical protein